MSEADFIARWAEEVPIYRAWGDFVTETVVREIGTCIAPRDVDEFLKLPAKPRVKEPRSLLDKAFHRKKPYTDPYNQIEDKVGVRFVVLHTGDIARIGDVIEASPNWTASRDRDFEAERERTPEFFGYQSVHYVVRASKDIGHSDITVSAGTPCEVQIRTLLQHAHSELTHDTIYKPQTTASSLAKRYCARSMALIEATDDFFVTVVGEIERAGEPLKRAMEHLAATYRTSIGREPEAAKVNTLILDAYVNKLDGNLGDRLSAFLAGRSYVGRVIAERADHQHLFRQPAILLLYYLADAGPRETKRQWPLTPDELRPIYDDLGQNFEV